jgi:hypothetical protein
MQPIAHPVITYVGRVANEYPPTAERLATSRRHGIQQQENER